MSQGEFDVLTLSEPHKHRQTGLLLRKHAAWERDRGVPFTEELQALAETPSAGVPRLGAAPRQPILAALADATRRTVHSALVLNPDTAEGLAAASVPPRPRSPRPSLSSSGRASSRTRTSAGRRSTRSGSPNNAS
ncbi:hypothetical protein AB0D11_47275 [Streptomyces monashensis]|uniref:hypothetical protein n=1 Tax=Streptomyces monashensis TaxID=1678012 RepID=UPI003410CA7F